MECLGKKRKGVEVVVVDRKELTSVEIARSHLSLKDYGRTKRKCKEIIVKDDVGVRLNVVPGVVTAPPCGSACLDPPTRGLKRKIGCIESATQLGRKKKIDQQYELGEIIGQGKFGYVIICTSKVSGEQFACKTLKKGEETVHREVEIMQHLSGHPGVVTLKAVYEDAESFHLVMELCSKGRLLDQMAKDGRFSEQRAATLIKELMLVIRYCHEMGVVHRDIKPENILLTSSGQIKLADFGLAVRILDGQSLTGIVGSPAYVAPEILVGDYSEKVDIWSAGILLHALLVGVLPFQGESLENVFEAIKKDDLNFNYGIWESVSQPARDLLSCMLTRDVSNRFTAAEVLSHPWILFYTEPTMKTHKLMPSRKKQINLTSKLTANTRVESERNRSTTSSSLYDDSRPIFSSHSSENMLEGEDSALVDILAVAISRVRISEPKRSRLWNPVRPIQPECSSNMKAGNLCTAF
ncbi:hypothetical protein ACH5RR_022402 [Cinchona calisaya]|uniref:Protein kinase domain-containing protein n=1 Tax=Cinchona calisaya TaxID=153742 RepID=A0ABD2ZAZ4_9GENT